MKMGIRPMKMGIRQGFTRDLSMIVINNIEGNWSNLIWTVMLIESSLKRNGKHYWDFPHYPNKKNLMVHDLESYKCIY